MSLVALAIHIPFLIFFTHSYDHLIIEEGKILKDMLYFKKALFSISPDIEMQK